MPPVLSIVDYDAWNKGYMPPSEHILIDSRMTNPKMKPCPMCGTDEALAVYKYDSGWRHVECDKCMYLGPGEGSVRQAIRSHNDRVSTPS